ncbi:MAG: DUF4235 domain-containing protein [Cellulomonas sp.]
MANRLTQSAKSNLVGTVLALIGAVVAQKAVSFIWKSASGHQPPDSESDAGLGEVAAAAIVTGAVMALVRVLAVRGARRAMLDD